jgi:Membrane-bound toxin component of toxin-antitoxin system
MAAVRLVLGPSRVLAVALALVHTLAAACILLLAPGASGALLAALVLVLAAAVIRDRALHRGRGAVRALELGADGAVTLELGNGRRAQGRVGERRNVGRGWTILTLRGMPRRNVLVMRDMLPPVEFRRLRLWALWGRLPSAPRILHGASVRPGPAELIPGHRVSGS